MCFRWLFGYYPLEDTVDFGFRQKWRQEPSEEFCLLPFLRYQVRTRGLVKLICCVELRQGVSYKRTEVLKRNVHTRRVWALRIRIAMADESIFLPFEILSAEYTSDRTD